MLAYDYPVLGLFWTMLIVFLWVAWLMLLFRVFADIFRNREMRGWAKALWSMFVLVVPLLGVMIYLIAHGDGMTRRDVAAATETEQAFQSYIRDVAGTSGGADELAKLSTLREQGVLTDAEFAAQKARLLA